MECDVICLDSDEESENGPGPVPKAYRSLYRPIQSTSSSPTGGEAGAIEEQLLRPLQALSLKLYFESDLGATWPAPSNRAAVEDGASRRMPVVRRVAELVSRFGRRKFSNSVQDVARQRDAWKQVLKFLFLLQAIGPGSMIYGATAGGRSAFTRNFQCHQEQIPPETRRYRLTVMDVLVDYIRYKCHLLAGERNPAVLLAECNQLVSSLYIIFDGDAEFVTLTLLKMDPVAGGGAVALMYPVFEQILTRRPPSTGPGPGQKVVATSIMDYVRLLLCYKKWKAMVPARRDKEAINALAIKILPVRCPPVRTKQDLPFVRMLPRLSSTAAKGHADETRFLLAKDLMEIEQLCAIFFREYEKRFQLQQPQPKLQVRGERCIAK